MPTPEHDASDTLDPNGPARTDAPAVDEDLQLAATTDVPVLISGDPAASLELACELHRRGAPSNPAVVLIDCRHHAAAARLAPAIAEPLRGSRPGRKAVLLLEVHALREDAQALLEERLELSLLHRRDTGFRAIASSSVPLFDRVTEGRFRERLYYFLNMIHIVVPPPAEG